MAVVIFADSALSVAANAKSADRVSGTYQHVGPGIFTVIAKASATGLNVTVTVGGVDLVNDLVIPGTGTAGTLDTSANIIASQALPGGRVEASYRNTTATAITADAIMYWEPVKA